MAAKKGKKRDKVKLLSTQSAHFYTTSKSKKATGKLNLKKYDPTLRKHVEYKETKLS